MNWYYRRLGKTANYAGTIIRQEIPLLVTTEVALVDPSDKYEPEIRLIVILTGK